LTPDDRCQLRNAHQRLALAAGELVERLALAIGERLAHRSDE
jgi:hypothetical protein